MGMRLSTVLVLGTVPVPALVLALAQEALSTTAATARGLGLVQALVVGRMHTRPLLAS